MVRIPGRGRQAVNASWFGHWEHDVLAGSWLEVRVDPNHQVAELFHRCNDPTWRLPLRWTRGIHFVLPQLPESLYMLSLVIEPQAFDSVVLPAD